MIKEMQTFYNFDDKDDFLTTFQGCHGRFLLCKIATMAATANLYFAKSRQDLNLGGLSFCVAALLSHQFLLTKL